MADRPALMTDFWLPTGQRVHRAILDNDLQALRWLVDSGRVEDICNKEADENGWSSLMLAARYNRREIFDYLLGLGHDDETVSTDAEGNTIPMVCAKYCHEDACLVYLERYPQTMSNVNRDGSSAINWAAQNGLNRVIAWILDHGGNANQRDIEGNTPLHHAASWNQYQTVALLLESDAQPTLKNHKGYTAIDYAYSPAMDKHIRDIVMRLQIKRHKRQAGSFSTPLARASGDTAPLTPPPSAM
ncbi:Target of rapamycin complex 2 subunit avo2 [Coemansia javaensis]|uniref:Target of rapamycin complex 2 subunit avo2 n=1 Tax=Coemansia javaensis TaxID=2761396 RepID=A0A9W8HBD8_9FUNG|nr:Target of rapamycin complex 2 subunit avo2 [Coemansia javaensis]